MGELSNLKKNKISQNWILSPSFGVPKTLRCHRLRQGHREAVELGGELVRELSAVDIRGWEAGDVQQKSSPGHRICRGNPGFLGHTWILTVECPAGSDCNLLVRPYRDLQPTFFLRVL